MRVFLNELALAEAWTSVPSACRILAEILNARHQQSMLRDALYCTQRMSSVLISSGKSLSHAAQELPRDMRIQLFSWISKHGPFVEDDRQFISDDLFYFENDDVTELGIGEAARRIQAKNNVATLSPIGNLTSRFGSDGLDVVHGLREAPIARIRVPNYTDIARLVEILIALSPAPKNWADLLEICRGRFDLLHIGPNCDKTIAHFPYIPAAGRRIIRLLGILQQIMSEMDNAGRLSQTGLELHSKYFTGEKACFSDESESRKSQPKKFTFPAPDGGDNIVCFLHGKITTATIAIRIYFDWPVDPDKKRIRIVYIGRHI